MKWRNEVVVKTTSNVYYKFNAENTSQASTDDTEAHWDVYTYVCRCWITIMFSRIKQTAALVIWGKHCCLLNPHRHTPRLLNTSQLRNEWDTVGYRLLQIQRQMRKAKCTSFVQVFVPWDLIWMVYLCVSQNIIKHSNNNRHLWEQLMVMFCIQIKTL